MKKYKVLALFAVLAITTGCAVVPVGSPGYYTPRYVAPPVYYYGYGPGIYYGPGWGWARGYHGHHGHR